MTIPELLPSKPMKMSLLFIGSDWPSRLAGLQTGIPFNIYIILYLLTDACTILVGVKYQLQNKILSILGLRRGLVSYLAIF